MKLIPYIVILMIFSSYAKVITIMNYNVENLFDTVHDEGKEDYSYLPLSVKNASPEIQKYCLSLRKKSWQKSCLNTDWNEEVLESKLTNIAKVIRSHSRKGPDILILQEVENLNVTKMLVDKKLAGMGYKHIALVEGLDVRGIDNAIISRYPIKSQKIHNFSLEPYSSRPTRGILEVDIKIKRKTLKILANHWPSQGSPSEARFIASEKLAEIASNSTAHLTLAVGDFNTLKRDAPHGINDNIIPLFRDAHLEAQKRGRLVREGSHWYKGHWSRLDRIFVYKKYRGRSKAKFKTFKIMARDFMFTDLRWENYDTGEVTVYKGVPKRFSWKTKQGFSDHLPLTLELRL